LKTCGYHCQPRFIKEEQREVEHRKHARQDRCNDRAGQCLPDRVNAHRPHAQITRGIVPKEWDRQTQQTIPHRRLDGSVGFAFDAQHGDTAGHLKKCHRQRDDQQDQADDEQLPPL
jgi:hypothetical protein